MSLTSIVPTVVRRNWDIGEDDSSMVREMSRFYKRSSSTGIVLYR